jgi:murein DD-endopeptidase MepM/ murein hydrolase activator NlpD
MVRPGRFPRPHLIAASTIALALLVLTAVLPESGADTEARSPSSADLVTGLSPPAGPAAGNAAVARERAPALEIQPAPADGSVAARIARLADVVPATSSHVRAEAAGPQSADPAAPARERTVKVRSGDSLASIFQREGIPARDLHLLTASTPLGKRLKRIHPGHELAFTFDADNTLEGLAYVTGPLERLEFVRNGDAFVAKELQREPERAQAYKHGVIENSLFVAGRRAGLTDTMTMHLAQVFQWDIDFVLEIRRGDEFSVLFEELYVDGEFIGYGNILAAEFVNQGRSHRAIRYTDSNGDSSFYSPEGRPLRKAFLRAPLEFSRISSNFNPNRRHPLFNRSMPHRGIDYAAPTGTPVYAAGDGRIVTAARNESSGNYVVIQHGQQVTTKYLHLSRFGKGVRQGVRVRQGQTIGYVGATGWATGPHLHYEFVVNGVHQNPRTVKLPAAEPIPKGEMARFLEHSGPLLALLDAHRQDLQLALAQ